MSDTPRTDAVKLLLPASNSPSEYVVDVDFARALERELAVVTDERNTLKAAEQLRQENAKLRGALEELAAICRHETLHTFSTTDCPACDSVRRAAALARSQGEGANATAHARAVASNVQQIVGNSGGDE